MDRHMVIFVTDQRQKFISEYLPGKVSSTIWMDEESEEKCLRMLQKADSIVFPTPALKVSISKDITEILKYNLTNAKMVFGGMFSPEWKKWFAEKGITCFDFMEDEVVARENALITAEATVAEIIKQTGYCIRGQKIVVTGYGRCGRAVANLLRDMGAKVIVLARSSQARKCAKADGHNATDFAYGAEEMYGTRTIVNTVPACVVTKALITEMHSDAIIIDIASAPGGCDLAAAEECGIPVVAATGLPGRYESRSSAKILADAIQRQMLPSSLKREDKSWIFQIII